MKEFKTMAAFQKHFEKRVVGQFFRKEKIALNFISKSLEKEAKEVIGYKQWGGGPFENWADLADFTKKDKEDKGYVFNADYNPLYRTGELRKSIHSVSFATDKFQKVITGSTSEIMVYQEFGTKKMPARSVLGLTLFRNKKEIIYVMKNFMLHCLIDKPYKFKRI